MKENYEKLELKYNAWKSWSGIRSGQMSFYGKQSLSLLHIIENVFPSWAKGKRIVSAVEEISVQFTLLYCFLLTASDISFVKECKQVKKQFHWRRSLMNEKWYFFYYISIIFLDIKPGYMI